MSPSSAARLPVFRLASPTLNRARIRLLVGELGLSRGSESPLPGGGVRIGDGRRVLEASPDGMYWFADEARLWNPARVPQWLPSTVEAADAAWDLVKRCRLLPESAVATLDTRIIVNARSKMCAAPWHPDGLVSREETIDIDAFVSFGTRVAVTHPLSDMPTHAQVLGPSTKLGVVLGASGQVIGLHAAWPTIDAIDEEAPALAPRLPVATRWLASRPHRQTIELGQPRLVYRRVTLASGAPCLCPFWLFAVTIVEGQRRLRAPDVVTKAVAVDLSCAGGCALKYHPRTSTSVPHDAPSRHSIAVAWKTLGASDANDEVALVLRQASQASWGVRFAWRDGDAWESDWTSEARTWVDSADLAYYVGHADQYGWELTEKQTPLRKQLTSLAVGRNDPDHQLWGERLKWIIVSACGPLQDNWKTNESGAFKWMGAFDGLRLLMGFASTTAGFTREGGRTLELARRGVPLARAWLRAAREGQPSTEPLDGGDPSVARWAAVLAAETDEESALDDCLPGPDDEMPRALRHPERLRAIWIPT